MIPPDVSAWLEAQDLGEITGAQAVGGGCINNGQRLQTSTGRSYFLKMNRSTPQDMFVREAEGLQALRQARGGPHVPEPLVWGPDFLLMEDLAPADRQPDYWPAFGRQLAAVHTLTSTRFGFEHDNYIGSTPQPNSWTEDGYAFFAGQRLMFQARLAQRNGYLGLNAVVRVERLGQRLPELVPGQPAALIHGDLWSGNALADANGRPALIDPAAYYGWPEADLAMTALFGGFPQAFYQGYQEVRPLEAGYRQRFPLYNLYHLLNHLNLFGEGYLGEVQTVLQHYT